MVIRKWERATRKESRMREGYQAIWREGHKAIRRDRGRGQLAQSYTSYEPIRRVRREREREL